MHAQNPLRQFVLGHMPFVGISYQSEEKDEECRKRFRNINATKEIIEAAVDLGVQKFAAATPRSSALAAIHLEVLRLIVADGREIEILPCIEIPIKLGSHAIDAVKRWATYASLEKGVYLDAVRRMLTDPVMNFREGWKTQLPTSRPYIEADFANLLVDWTQIDDDLRSFADLPVGGVELGSESDFLAMCGRLDLLGELRDRVKEQGFGRFLLGIHHAGVTIPILDDALQEVYGYVTPLNPLGVMMFPTKLSAEKAVRATRKAVFAIKPLAGGRVDPTVAFKYVSAFHVEACMVGVASVDELKEDVEAALAVLGRPC